MRLYNLGKVPWEDSQLLYHALAYMGQESLVLLSPETPYVCIGYHQNVGHEVDEAFCLSQGIPIFRREVGGGAVYLDGNQTFFQLVLSARNPVVPHGKEGFYRKFLQPVIHVYRRMGIPAVYKSVNDVVSGDRKISGTGVGELGSCIAFVGNLIRDFDFATMSRVLKVPDEKFRDKVRKTLEDNLSTIGRELGEKESGRWSEDRLCTMLAEEFAKVVGAMEPCGVDGRLRAKMQELRLRMMDDAWLHRKGRVAASRNVKVRSGVEVVHRVHKAPGGIIRADYLLTEDRLGSVSLSGDFFCYPSDAVTGLESALEGRKKGEVPEVLAVYYARQKVETPGVRLEDWVEVLQG